MSRQEPTPADRSFGPGGIPRPPIPPGDGLEPMPLSGRTVLIVEDEFLIADDIAAMLRESGAEVIGPASSLPAGIRLAADTRQIDAALLNIDLGGTAVFPLADQLAGRGVPIMFMTGYGESEIPPEYWHIRRCEKPVAPGRLVAELAQLLIRPVAA